MRGDIKVKINEFWKNVWGLYLYYFEWEKAIVNRTEINVSVLTIGCLKLIITIIHSKEREIMQKRPSVLDKYIFCHFIHFIIKNILLNI